MNIFRRLLNMITIDKLMRRVFIPEFKALILHLIPIRIIKVAIKNRQYKKIIFIFGFCISKIKYDLKDVDTCIYLKINADDEKSYICIQQWCDVADAIGYPIVFVCDSLWLKQQVLQRINFSNDNFGFLKSKRGFKERAIARKIGLDYSWRNCAYAHFVPYWHSKKRNIKYHWDIDGDDTMFLLEKEDIMKAMINVESEAKRKGYDAISLDMWKSRTCGQQWTLGVVFTNNNENVISVLENIDLQWKNNLRIHDYCIDWYFSVCNDVGRLNLKTFYVDRAAFIHWGDVIINPITRGMTYWSDGYLKHLVLNMIFSNDELGLIKIDKEVIKIDIGLCGKEYIDYYANRFCRKFTDTEKKLFCLR